MGILCEGEGDKVGAGNNDLKKNQGKEAKKKLDQVALTGPIGEGYWGKSAGLGNRGFVLCIQGRIKSEKEAEGGPIGDYLNLDPVVSP